MPDLNKITEVIFTAIDEYNEQATSQQKLEKSLDTVLLGPEGAIDSLGLVRLIITIEQNITEQLGEVVTLADERSMSMKNSPFRSVNALVEYITTLLAEQVDE